MSTVRFFRHSTQFFQHYIPTEFVLLAIVEFLVLMGGFYIGQELRFWEQGGTEYLDPFMAKALVYSVVMQMSLIALGAYQRQSKQSIELLLLRIGGSFLLGLVPLGLTYYIVPMFFLGRGALAFVVAVSFLGIVLVRLIFNKIGAERDLRLRIVVLGAGDTANLMRNAADTGELQGVNIVGYIRMPGDNDETVTSHHDDILELPDSLIAYVEEERIDEVVLAADDRRKGLPVQDLLDVKMSGLDVSDLLTFFERETGKIRLDIMHPSWLFLSDGFRESAFRRFGKRFSDILIVLVISPIVVPLMIFTALAVFIEARGKGAVFYSQTRVCENGRPFQIYKFRSMITDAECDGVARWASKEDDRITKIGAIMRKCRLDELPQLLNVLKGDMSFVGPRPERPEFTETLAKSIPYYNERHRVKPGLTGWAQIRYPYGASEEDGLEKLQYDLYYVKNYSIFMDTLILLQTAEVVLLGKGAQ